MNETLQPGFRFMSRSTQADLPSDPQSRADVEQCVRDGFVILSDVFTSAQAAEAKVEIDRLSGKDPIPGRNAFEGLATTRIYSLLNKSRVFDKFAMLPRVLALNDYFLSPGYLISAMHTIQINPGEAPQELHHDDAFCADLPKPRAPLGTAIIVALDDFTELNGATNIIPGSHTWDSSRQGQLSDTRPAIMKAGSVVYFIATTLHGGGSNRSGKPRQSLTVQYCQPYIRQIENQMLAVDPRKVDKGEIPQRIVDMMGYRVHRPFIGYVDGMGPRAGARRLIKWLQGPVDRNPPTFMHSADSKL